MVLLPKVQAPKCIRWGFKLKIARGEINPRNTFAVMLVIVRYHDQSHQLEGLMPCAPPSWW